MSVLLLYVYVTKSGASFLGMPDKILTNEYRYYISNIFSYWLKPLQPWLKKKTSVAPFTNMDI